MYDSPDYIQSLLQSMGMYDQYYNQQPVSYMPPAIQQQSVLQNSVVPTSPWSEEMTRLMMSGGTQDLGTDPNQPVEYSFGSTGVGTQATPEQMARQQANQYVTPAGADASYYYIPDSGPVMTGYTPEQREDIENAQQDARTRGIGTVAALVGGGAALGATPWGSVSPSASGAGLSEITLPASVAPTGAIASGLGPSIPAAQAAAGTGAAAGLAMGPGTPAAVAGATTGGAANVVDTITNTGQSGADVAGNVADAVGGNFQNWVPLITDLVSGLIGVNASNNAVEAQERSTQAVLDFARENRDKALQLNQPFYDASRTALDRMMGMTGMGGTPVDQNALLNADPSYQFRRDESMRALEGGAAARGGLLSGNFGKQALQLAGNYASQEYSNIYNRIAQIAGYGQGATANSQNALTNYASMAGDAAMSTGLANASAYTAQGNVLMDLAQRLGQFDWSSIGGGRRG